MHCCGLDIATREDVYEPAEDSFLAAEHLLDILRTKRGSTFSVLDMGCGTGLLGLLAATSPKVGEALLCDSNASAVRLARRNRDSNRKRLVAPCSFIVTDLFAKVPAGKRFDLIVFNTPYLPEERKGVSGIDSALSGGSEGIDVAVEFLKQARRHMKPNADLLLVSSSFAALRKLSRAASGLGYSPVERRKRHVFFEDIVSIRLRRK